MRFLFVDRIVQSIPGQVVRGIKHITRDDYYLHRDEQGRLCFFSALIGETLGQLAAWNVMAHCDFTHRPVAGVVERACLHRKAYVGETLLLESFIDRLDETAVQYHSVARVADEVVFTIEGALGPLLPMNDFIDAGDIRRQFSEIDRPGDWSIVSARASGALVEDLPDDVMSHSASMNFDRIIASEPGVSLRAEKHLTRAAPYFADHFPNKPVLPLTVLLECKCNLALEFLARAHFEKHYRIREMRKIKMNGFVSPGDIVVCSVTVKKQTDDELILSYRSEVDGKRVCVLDMVLV